MRISAQKLFFLAFFLFLALFAGISHKTYAQTPGTLDEIEATTPQADIQTENLDAEANVEMNMHNGVQILLIETMSAMACQLTGVDPTRPGTQCLGVNPETGKIGYVENGGGLIAVMGKAIDMTFTPPASFTQYTAYLKGNFGVGDKVYAQENTDPCKNLSRGVGFCGLQPVLPLWVAMRNIVYLILILAFVVVGLGIMLRVHIDAHDVMTIQNQLPKIIMGIIAVTFSFAIAGLLIDIMFVATYLFAFVIQSATSTVVSPEAANAVVGASNPFNAANAAFSENGGILGIAGQVSSAFAEVIKSVFTGPSSNFGNGDIVGNIIGGVVGVIVNILAFLIIAIAVVVCLFRVWVVLVVAYVNLILDIIFAPFWIIAGVMPGSKAGIGVWIKDLLANLAVYPVAVAFFLLASYFIESFNGDSVTRFVPPLVGGTNTEAIGAIVGLGFILMLPNVLTTTKDAFKAPGVNFGNIMGPLGVGGKYLGIPKTAADTWARNVHAQHGGGKGTNILAKAMIYSGFTKPYGSGH